MDALPLISDNDLPSRMAHAILFPADCVRVNALRYFSRAANPPETIMPRVIEAIEQYGRDQARDLLAECDTLPQTEATIAWIGAELDREWPLEDREIDDYCCALANILCHARLDLLREDMTDLRSFPEELKGAFHERFTLAGTDWDALFAQLEALGKDIIADNHTNGFVRHRVNRIIEAMARHTDKADAVLAYLRGQHEQNDADLAEWMELQFIAIAGAMRLKEAIHDLAPMLATADLSPRETCAEKALCAIGGDQVAQAVVEMLLHEKLEVRSSARYVLQDVRSTACLDKYWEAFHWESQDNSFKSDIACLLLNNCDVRAVEVAHAMLKDDELRTKNPLLRTALLTAAVVLGTHIPEFDEWLKEDIAHAEALDDLRYDEALRRRYDENPDRELTVSDYDDWDEWREFELDDTDFDGEDWDGDLNDEGFDDEDWDDEDSDPYAEPIRNGSHATGRNAPCPCGSGKKFKKCCMGKEDAGCVLDELRAEPASEQSEASLVRLGPDQRRTTRIIATVVPRPGSQPIRRQWQGNNLNFNNKVRMEIRDFFAKHDKPMPDDPGVNIGCPHEAGKDYPSGGDCPHCAYWQGKQ